MMASFVIGKNKAIPAKAHGVSRLCSLGAKGEKK
jgi:hypothetical protein